MPTETCISDLKERLLLLFNGGGIDDNNYKPEEDKDLMFIKEIRSCPRDEAIASLLDLQIKNKDSIELTAKSAYLLVKIGSEKERAGEALISTFSAKHKEILDRYRDKDYGDKVKNNKYDDKFGELEILDLISDVIENDYKDLLPKTFEIAPETDGVSSEQLSFIYSRAFRSDPEGFLRMLKVKSVRVKGSVYQLLIPGLTKDQLKKCLSQIPKNSDVSSMAEDMRRISAKSNVDF